MGQVSWVKQLILATALLVLGTAAWWIEFKHRPEKESAEENTKKLFVIDGKQIETLTLNDGKKTIDWSCQDLAAKTCKPGDNAKWKMNAPMQVRADDANLNALVSALNNLVPTELIDLKDETPEKRTQLLKDYGLSPEELKNPVTRRISVKTTEGETTTYFGAVHPINDNTFALVAKNGKPDENRVYLVPSYFKSNFDHDLTYWRDKKVLAFAASEIQAFQIDSAKNGKLSAEKKDDQWTVKTKEGEFAGDIENVDSLLSGAAYLTAKNFLTDQKNSPQGKAALKGAKPIVSIRFEKAKGASGEASEPVTLTLYEKGGSSGKRSPSSDRHGHGHDHGIQQGAAPSSQILATVSNTDPVYELGSASRNQLDKGLKDLRLTKLITSVDRFSAKKLEFSGAPMGDQPLVLVSQDGSWVASSEKKPVSNDKVQSTLDKLSGNRIKEFLSGSAIPSGENEGLKLTLGDEKNPAKRQLVFWKKDGKLYARDLSSTRKEAFLVDSAVIDGLPWDRNYFAK